MLSREVESRNSTAVQSCYDISEFISSIILIFVMCRIIVILYSAWYLVNTVNSSKPPNIVYIFADDLGFNDVGFRGSSQIPTPNIDALAFSGVILNNYYVQPLCSPSRSALLTGRHPIHTGLQNYVIVMQAPYGLPLSETTLPQHLKNLGYSTHLVGKWHQGFCKIEYTPTYRGFDSFFGYWGSHKDYYDHSTASKGMWGIDIRNGTRNAWENVGEYTTRLFTRSAVDLINKHDDTTPFFLYISHLAVHIGNDYSPMQAPMETVARFEYIQDNERRQYAAMLYELDQSVGAVVNALREKNMLENTIIVFSTDNGGMVTSGSDVGGASNWPLRGMKNTPWEGAVRGAGLVWSPLLNSSGRVENNLMDLTDWLPTLYSAAGGNLSDFDSLELDGMNQWNSLSSGAPSPRTEMVHNIETYQNYSAVRRREWKLVIGTVGNGTRDAWYQAKEDNRSWVEDDIYLAQLQDSIVGQSMQALNLSFPSNLTALRKSALIQCGDVPIVDCNPLAAPCLFNVVQDPCERQNLADTESDILKSMLALHQEYEESAVPSLMVPVDPKGDPKFFNYAWTNWKDYE